VLVWHVQNPTATPAEGAVVTGYCAKHLSRIIHSQAFQARLAEVRKERERLIVARIMERAAGPQGKALVPGGRWH
jgi:hypothetical protein